MRDRFMSASSLSHHPYPQQFPRLLRRTLSVSICSLEIAQQTYKTYLVAAFEHSDRASNTLAAHIGHHVTILHGHIIIAVCAPKRIVSQMHLWKNGVVPGSLKAWSVKASILACTTLVDGVIGKQL